MLSNSISLIPLRQLFNENKIEEVENISETSSEKTFYNFKELIKNSLKKNDNQSKFKIQGHPSENNSINDSTYSKLNSNQIENPSNHPPSDMIKFGDQANADNFGSFKSGDNASSSSNANVMNNNYIADENSNYYVMQDGSPTKERNKIYGEEDPYSPYKNLERVKAYGNDEINVDSKANENEIIYNDQNLLEMQYLNENEIEESPLKRKRVENKSKKKKHKK